MAKIVTENFKTEIATEFVDSFRDETNLLVQSFENLVRSYNISESVGLSDDEIEEVVNIVRGEVQRFLPQDQYYVIGSSVDRENEIENTQFEKREFQRRAIFGTKVSINNVKYMFLRRPWESGTVYNQFDDLVDVEQSNIYVTVLEGEQEEGPYKVFKCISNNRGAASTVKPSLNALDPAIEVELSDGYIWKYMFTIPVAEYNEYSTRTSLPYVEDTSVSRFTKEQISNIIIEDTVPNLFSQYDPGTLRLNSILAGTQENSYNIELQTFDVAPRSGSGSYNNMYLRSQDDGKVFDIIDSTVPNSSSANRTLNLVVSSATDIRTIGYTNFTSNFEIVPKIDVSPSNTISANEIDQSFAVTNNGQNNYVINGAANPTLSLVRGQTYQFNVSATGHPFWLQTDVPTWPFINTSVLNTNDGVTNNGTADGTITYTVPTDAPDTIYYRCENHPTMSGTIQISGAGTSLNTNAVAYGRLDANGTLDEVKFVNKGNGYKFATAKVSLPPALAQTYTNVEDATRLRVIVSPKNGHGSDPVSELAMSRIAVSANILSDAQTQIPDTNTYTKVGLLKNPQFNTGVFPETFDNRLRLELTSEPNASVGQYVIEEKSDQIVYGIIHEIKQENGVWVVYLVDYTADFNETFTQNAQLQIKDSLTADAFEIATINNSDTAIQTGDYIPFSGELLHFVDFQPITRSANRKEKVKFVFDF